MEPTYIRTGTDAEAEAYSKLGGHWTVANLHQSIGWTQKPTTIEYAGQTLLLLPEDAKHHPAIATHGEPDTSRRLILEFASALAWSHGGDVTIEYWTGGSQIFRAAKSPIVGQISAMTFQVTYLPAPAEPDRKLALALFHEGSGLARVHVAYSFLSFYKIINLVSGTRGNEQIAWINRHVGLMIHHRSAKRLSELQASRTDIGVYLYQSCRCAIAHAGDPRNPVVDPHNLEDQRRLHSDLPLIIALAEIAIEELGIKTSGTVYREHRYELSGFESLLAPGFVDQLKAGATPQQEFVELPSHFSIRMWGKQTYQPLENMMAEVGQVSDGVLSIRCRSETKRYLANLVLDFPDYRLKVEVGAEDLKDDGSAEFIEETIEIERFFWDWNGNGCLEVWSDEGVCLGRCDAFIPVNVIMDSANYQRRIDELSAEAARRRGAG